MPSIRPIPSYVHHEIRTHLANEQWDYALQAAMRVIDEYPDIEKREPYHLLWFFHAGARAAKELGEGELAIGLGNAFVTLTEKLYQAGPNVRQVYADQNHIRIPRADELDEARRQLHECEQGYREARLSLQDITKETAEAIEQKIQSAKTQFLPKGMGCLVAVFMPMSLMKLFAIYWT